MLSWALPSYLLLSQLLSSLILLPFMCPFLSNVCLLVSVLEATSYIQYIHAANSQLTKRATPISSPLELCILVH